VICVVSELTEDQVLAYGQNPALPEHIRTTVRQGRLNATQAFREQITGAYKLYEYAKDSDAFSYVYPIVATALSLSLFYPFGFVR